VLIAVDIGMMGTPPDKAGATEASKGVGGFAALRHAFAWAYRLLVFA
jgi:hypothetical protein